MAKIDKDQFEKFLEDNCPGEEPSAEVFDRLQKEAAWNKPPATAKLSTPVLLAAIIVILAILIYAGNRKPVEKPLQNQSETEPKNRPEIPEDPLPVAVIARGEEVFNLGSYRFMKNRSDDFNLSFAQDSSSQTMLGFARELNNI